MNNSDRICPTAPDFFAQKFIGNLPFSQRIKKSGERDCLATAGEERERRSIKHHDYFMSKARWERSLVSVGNRGDDWWRRHTLQLSVLVAGYVTTDWDDWTFDDGSF